MMSWKRAYAPSQAYSLALGPRTYGTVLPRCACASEGRVADHTHRDVARMLRSSEGREGGRGRYVRSRANPLEVGRARGHGLS